MPESLNREIFRGVILDSKFVLHLDSSYDGFLLRLGADTFAGAIYVICSLRGCQRSNKDISNYRISATTHICKLSHRYYTWFFAGSILTKNTT